MKILIVDDENHVIEAVKLLVPWDELGINQIFSANSASEAEAIIEKERPQIVIMDIIMNDKSGIDLVRFIRRNYPSIKSIAISGHSDFEYVRTMLINGSIDYLLKPLESEALIHAITKAIDEWNKDNKNNTGESSIFNKGEAYSAHYAETLLFSKMLKEEAFEASYQELIKKEPNFKSINECTLLYYNINYFPMNNPDFTILLDKFESQVRENLSDQQSGIIFNGIDNSNSVVIFIYKNVKLSLQKINEISNSLFKKQSYPFHLGCSPQLLFPGELKKSLSLAKEAFFMVDCLKVPEHITYLNSRCNDNSRITSTGFENQILSALIAGDDSKIENAVSIWLKTLLPEGAIPLYIVRDIISLFYKLLLHWAVQLNKYFPDFTHDQSGCGFTYQQLINEKYLFEPGLLKSSLISDILYLFNEVRHTDKNKDIFNKIKYYIELNYQKPFSLAECSKLFYLNQDYICRTFKKKYKISMVSYLNQIRIENSKMILKNTSLSLREIAGEVGFNDEKYFTRQFKKLTGMTPSEYRNVTV